MGAPRKQRTAGSARLPDLTARSDQRPASIPSRPIEGWGTHRIEVEGEEIAFSDEAVGIQVIFATDRLDATRAREIVDDIAGNIEATTGQRARVVEL